MDRKVGFNVTTSMLAFAALSGCASQDANAVASSSAFDPTLSANKQENCSAANVLCETQDLALLQAPENVVYTTRAVIAPVFQTRDNAQLERTSDTPTSGSIIPQEDAERSE